ncbi:diacylglycerol kinase family protein [Virgibacillus sp. MSP4-1]|uniref:diacylglycerol kinase family protein n=1 Tax=Virgibacillus sp. MSP4-1 TaxID=2700081 RepID=UPI0005C70135|nr:diacylglycerol kinase family protein [Virgibacillus sp. MSP4-1]QHS22792.1 diacylglycerol kinase family protein [Virgibacillus sp. MSP4-1]
MNSDLNGNKRKKGIGLKYAFIGLRRVWTSEKNFRIHIVISGLVIFFGILLNLSLSEWLWTGACIGLVLILETLNSAIEAIVDYLFPNYHDAAAKAKDISAAAVLLSALFAVFVGVLIFVPKIINLF